MITNYICTKCKRVIAGDDLCVCLSDSTGFDVLLPELCKLFNSIDSKCNTRDFMLAQYVVDCLMAYNRTVKVEKNLQRKERDMEESTTLAPKGASLRREISGGG